MLGHSPVLALSHEQTLLPNQPFFSWLRTETTLFISQIGALLGAVGFVASLLYYVSHVGAERKYLTPAYINVFVDYAHLLFIGIFILVLIRILDDNERGSYRASLVQQRVFNHDLTTPVFKGLTHDKGQLRIFKKYFLRFWVVMFLLYLAFAFEHGSQLSVTTYENVADVETAVVVPASTAGVISVLLEGTTAANQGAAVLPPQESVKASLPIIGWAMKEPCCKESTENALIGKHSAATDSKGRQQLNKRALFVVLTFLLNNLSLYYVFRCFVVLYSPSHRVRKKHPNTHKQNSQKSANRTKTNKLQQIATDTTTAQKKKRLRSREKSTFLEDDLRKKRLKIVSIFAFALLVLSVTFPALLYRASRAHNLADYEAILRAYGALFDTLSGTLNAVVLALLIARLDSKLIGLPSWLICVLYFYSGVQPLFVVFAQPSPVLSIIKTAVLIVVFIFKIYFFLIITYTLQTGRMLNYLVCYPFLNERIDNFRNPKPRKEIPPSGETTAASSAETQNEPSLFSQKLKAMPNDKKIAKTPTGLTLRERFSSPSAWMGSRGPLHLGDIVGLTALIGFVCSLYYIHSYGMPTNFDLKSVVDYGHLLFISAFIGALLVVRKDNSAGSTKIRRMYKKLFHDVLPRLKSDDTLEKTEKQLRNFKRYFLWFWLAMLPLYIVFTVEHQTGWTLGGGLTPLADPYTKLVLPFLTFMLGSLTLLFVFWCFVSLYLPALDKHSEARQRVLIHYSLFAVTLLVAAFLLLINVASGAISESFLNHYTTVFEGLLGTLSAVALALLVARFDSKLFGLPPRLIAVLFAYSAIQPLIVVFGQPGFEAIRTSALIAAFAFKICFFLVVVHALQSGSMLEYLVCYPFLNKRVDSVFENQFEIKTAREEPSLFTLSILRRNQLVYSTETTFSSRQECDAAVHKLRERMKKSDAYWQPRAESGTYWVEVRIKADLICESIPVRSEDEAEELIDESIDKIPYCKYNRA